MQEKLRFLGLDVHAETIAVAIEEPDGEVRNLGTPNRVESIRKLIRKLGPAEKLRACYEAGPTGYVVYWQLAKLGIQCEVVAPTYHQNGQRAFETNRRRSVTELSSSHMYLVRIAQTTGEYVLAILFLWNCEADSCVLKPHKLRQKAEYSVRSRI